MRHLSISLPVIAALLVGPAIRSLNADDSSARNVSGQEFTATVHVPAHEIAVEGVLFLPEKVQHAQGVITIVHWGLGKKVYEDAEWRELSERTQSGLLLARIRVEGTAEAQQVIRNAAMGGGEGLVLLLERLAEQSGHPELGSAKLLLWGHSAAGTFAMTFATLHPERTIAFIRYHSHMRNLPVDIESASQVPGLFLAGETDETAGVEDAEALWQKGRDVSAPWTFAIEPGASHGSKEGLKQANRVAIPWMTAMYQLRMARDDAKLRAVNDRFGWLGNLQTGAISPYDSYAGIKQDASWLPDEAAARGWRIVAGFAR